MDRGKARNFPSFLRGFPRFPAADEAARSIIASIRVGLRLAGRSPGGQQELSY